MLKHHRLDLLLVLIALIQVGLLILPFIVPLPLSILTILLLLNVILIGTNYQCVAHNFIHNPFFKVPLLNGLFSILNSLCLGIPESMYKVHHMEHHRHNNNPEKDESSTFRHGKDGQQENILSYSVLGVLRTNLPFLYKTARKQSPLVVIELIALMYFIGSLVLINWKLGVLYLVGSYLFGQIFALWENYCEHNHADYSDRKRDSVSCYDSLYNLLWFNNGYHQEHHFSPQVHWTKIQTIRKALPEDRMIVKGCHLSNSFDLYRKEGKK